MNRKTTTKVATKKVANAKADLTDEVIKDDPDGGYTLLIHDGKALKLSPKTKNHVFYQLAIKQDDKTLHIRMTGNEGGGLHSKAWVSLPAIFEILDGLKNKPIKSNALQPVFKGSSANNCGFMAAILRSPEIGLLQKSESSAFMHVLSAEYEANRSKLMAMLA